MAAGILARVPAELDALNEEVVVTACIGLGFTIERPRGRRIFAIELGNGALVDGLPGVPGGSSYVGSFDREEAVEEETLDFFASGHPLVEGIFAHFEESALGRVARFEVEIGQERGEGLVAVYKDGPVFEVVAIDSDGPGSARLGGGVPSATAPRAPGDRRTDRGPKLEAHGSPTGCAARTGAPSACGRGHRRAAGSVSQTQTTTSTNLFEKRISWPSRPIVGLRNQLARRDTHKTRRRYAVLSHPHVGAIRMDTEKPDRDEGIHHQLTD